MITLADDPGFTVLTPESIVSGTLFDSYGNPIVDEPVYLSSLTTHRHESTLTDAGGVFLFPGMPPGDDYRLTVTPIKCCHQYSIEPFVVAPPVSSVDIVLDVFPRGDVSGYLVDFNGMPVPHIGLVVYSDAQGTSSIKVQTDENGWFHANDVAAGQLTFAIGGPAYMPIHTLLLQEAESLFAGIVLDKHWQSFTGSAAAENDAALSHIQAGRSRGVSSSNASDR